MKNSSYLSVFEDETECSETSAYKIQTPGNYLEESIQKKVFCFIWQYILFMNESAINIADVTQAHISLVRLFYDTTSTAEVFICETNVVCDVNCV